MTDKFDILIPLGAGSRYDNLELRYCLRSIEKHLKNVGNVVIVGEKPEWLQNIIHIPFIESFNNWNRARNIYRKILLGCSKPDLSETFIYMNDDHFLLKDFDADGFPYYHSGEILPSRYIDNEPQYRQMLNTCVALARRYADTCNNFDIHCPVNFDKEVFIKLFNKLHNDWPEYGYCIKSFYCNQLTDIELISSEVEDLKFKEAAMKETIYKVLRSREWFSIGDRCLRGGDMKQVLQELYPNKSKYEF